MLSQCNILLAEDEPITALDLIHAIEAQHGHVVGPFAKASEALASLNDGDVHGAILDVQLSDGDVAALAVALCDRHTFLVFHTASPLPKTITERCGPQLVCRKPTMSDEVVLTLARLMGRAG